MRALLTAAAILAAGQVQAATLDFKFSFTTWENEYVYITGIIRGLEDNETGAATSVDVLTNSKGFGIGEYATHPITNTFTVKNGKLFVFSFFALGGYNSEPSVTDASLDLTRWLDHGSFVTDLAANSDPFGLSYYGERLTNPKFENGLAMIPLPASLPLLAGALLMLRYRRRLCK